MYPIFLYSLQTLKFTVLASFYSKNILVFCLFFSCVRHKIIYNAYYIWYEFPSLSSRGVVSKNGKCNLFILWRSTPTPLTKLPIQNFPNHTKSLNSNHPPLSIHSHFNPIPTTFHPNHSIFYYHSSNFQHHHTIYNLDYRE